MSDTPTPPTPPAEPNPTPGDIDKKLLAAIKLGEDVIEAATTDPSHTAALTAEELDEDALPDLATYTGEARTLAARVVPTKRARNAATRAEAATLKTLLAVLRDIQKRAKRKFPKDKARQGAYLIGKNNLGKNRTELEEDAETILAVGASDGLPGLTPAKLTAATAALGAWKDADASQVTAEEEQGKLLKALEVKVAQINEVRREVQRTADLAWPHTDPANAPIRRTFKLPPNKPFGV